MRVALDTAYQVKPPQYAQINRAHPLAQGLVSYWMMPQGGQVPIDAVSGLPAILNGTPLGAGSTRYGAAPQFSVGNCYLTPYLALHQVLFPMSMAVLYQPPASISTYTVPFSTYNNPAANLGGFALSVRSGGAWNSFLANTGGFEYWSYYITQNTIPGGVPAFLSYSWRSLADTSLYTNGVKSTISTSSTGYSPSYAAHGGALGQWKDNNGSNYGLDGILIMAATWSRNLSDAEHMQLAKQPFCMFNRRPMPVAA